jgi:flagellar M-ring protein FliF
MKDAINQVMTLIGTMPLSKKLSMVFVLMLVVTGFAFMFIWANQTDYQVLFNNLSPEDGGAIVSKLRETRVPYKVEANGTLIMVPADKVHELRLSLAGEGLPNGGQVGFEIFDEADFRTTKFVQELNYRRALQGELSRTINQFEEVKRSKVFIVLPKETLFVDEQKPASASIQLDLKSNLPQNKMASIAHLVANAVEGLEPENVTVVDTKGRLIFKGGPRDESSALLSNAQLDYKGKVEEEIRKNVQTMLEGIVGPGKAIVRVNAEIDFNKTTLNQEEYDPSAPAVRSERNLQESSETNEGEKESSQTLINQRSGVVPASTGNRQASSKKDVATNYEINKTTRTIFKPAGTIKRLSVAAVIDGTYQDEKTEDGTATKRYIPRSDTELKKFEDIVKKAMGYNEDREDQVTAISFPFSESIIADAMTGDEGQGFDFFSLLKGYKGSLINLFLVALVFFLVVRPLLKGLKDMAVSTVVERGGELSEGSGEVPQIPEPKEINQKEKILEITKNSPEKSHQLLKGWIAEQEQ